MSEFIEGLDGDFFVQTQLSENFAWLSCVSLADLPLPLGDLTTVYCPDPARKGHVVAAGQIRGDPATATTTITRPLSSVVNWLLENECAFNAFVPWACQGARVVPDNYEVGVVLLDARPSNSSVLAPVVRTRGEDARIDTNAEISYTGRFMIYHLMVSPLTLTNTAAANGIIFLPEACESKCASARDGCEEGYMALDGTLYDSEIKFSLNGTTWTQTTTDPFAEGGNAGPMVIFEMWDGHRMVVGRISASLWRAAEVAYTEDWGVTWSNVDVGAVVGQTINDLDEEEGYIWACCSGGDIYRSTDLAVNWTRISTGATAQDLNAISMYSAQVGFAVGNNNAFLYTNNGTDWFARTGPAAGTNLLSVAVNTGGHVFVGAADGALYVSEDDGVTWTTRRDFGVGSIDEIKLDDNLYFGGLIFNTAAPLGTFYRTFNGGATWIAPAGQTGAWNSGLNDFAICDPNNFFLVGELHGGVTFAAVVEPTA